MKTIIFDIDGTLADLTHRLKFLPHDWNSFHEAAAFDKPITPIIDLCLKYLSDKSYKVLFCTARPEYTRSITINWLHLWGINIAESQLYMRADGDKTKDWIIKSEMLDQIQANGHDVHLVIEDRQECVDMWRDRGIICLQCDEGDY